MLKLWRNHAALIAILITLFTPARGQAQSGFKDNVVDLIKKVGAHGNVGIRHPLDEDVSKGMSLGGSIGLAPGHSSGWKYPVSLVLFSEDLHGPNGPRFGFVRHFGLLGGVGYGWHFGRLSTGAQFQVGYALTREKADGDVPAAFGVPSVRVEADNAFLWRPQFKVEYFITPKFTLRSGVDYMHSNPGVVVTTPSGQIHGWDLSNVHANFGIGVYPFRR